MKSVSFKSLRTGKVVISVIALLLIISFIGSVLAITASIGNARMILRANVGETIQKTILVKNINNETVNIELFASGDLEKDIKIKDANFSLAPNEERNAAFTIKVTKEGTYESQVNVKFFSVIEKKGVGLSSSIVVIASKNNGTVDEGDVTDQTNSTSVTDIIGNIVGGKDGKKLNIFVILLIATGLIFLVFFILLIIYYKKSKERSYEEVSIKTKPKRAIKKI
jgi:hypothetical protein